MEIETIAYFLTVAECLNFSEAAGRNHISQSSFSKAIMRLEKDVGVRLIDRSRHPIRLTEAGKTFYEDCSRLRPLYLEALHRLESFTEKKRLRLLTCPKSYAFRAALSDYAQDHPDVLVEYEQTADYAGLIDRLSQGDFDFCITPKPMMIPPTLKCTELYADQPYLLVGSETELARNKDVSFQDLNGLDFYESPFSWYFVNELSRYFRFTPHAVRPDPEETLAHTVRREEVIHRVSMGRAVSIYCSRDVSMFNDHRIRLLPIRELPELPVVLLEKAGSRDTPERAQIRKWLISSLETYVCPPIK